MALLLGAITGSALLLPNAPAPQIGAALAPATCVSPRVAAGLVRMQQDDFPPDPFQNEAVPQPEEEKSLVEVGSKVGAQSTTSLSDRIPAPAPVTNALPWGIKKVSPDGSLVQRVEGRTRKTWKFLDASKERVQVALTSSGRPVKSDIQLWIGPNWTPFKVQCYSEDGKLRPIQTLVGTRNKAAMIEVRNEGEYEFPFDAASNYAEGALAALPKDLPASTDGERVDGGAIRSYPLNTMTESLEVVLKTDGRQLNAKIELLSGPNNPKQVYEVFTNNGELNSLCVSFNTPDPATTVRIVNHATIEFPCYVHLKEK